MTKNPSLDSEAALIAGSFFAQMANTELCKSFIAHMTQQGEAIAKSHRLPSGGSRVRNNCLRWADWMTQALIARGFLIKPLVEENPELEHLIPTDPIEARVHMRKRSNVKALVSTPPPVVNPPPVDEIEDLQNVFDSIEMNNEKNSARRSLLIELCDTAEKLCDQLIEKGKLLGVSELRQPPLVVSNSGQLGVLVQSFTVVRQGTIYKGDFKVNGHPITVHNQDMILQRNGEKLIRSNREDKQNYLKGRHELYVKGMNYQEGAVYLSYVMVDGEEDSELTNYYQLQGGQAVKVDAKRYRKVETLLASGRDPALSISDSS